MDYILRATAGNGSVRAFIANTKDLVQKGFEIHKTSPVITAALGRTLTAATIMGSMLKSDKDLITISLKGNGPANGLIVTGDNESRVKGYCYQNIVDLPLKSNGKLDVSGALGDGTLTVIKDMGLKEPYIGQVPLVSGEIAEDLTYYFAKSEQTPSSVALGVLVDRNYEVKQSGGFIIQLMPNADEEIILNLENKLKHLKPITTMLEEKMSIEDIINVILGDFELKITDKIYPKYYCNCSRERVEKVLISIGAEEINKIIEEDEKTTLHCHFCNKNYTFNKEDLKNILKFSAK